MQEEIQEVNRNRQYWYYDQLTDVEKEQFANNLFTQTGQSLVTYIESAPGRSCYNFIISSFDFNKTPEGIEYWIKISQRFLTETVLTNIAASRNLASQAEIKLVQLQTELDALKVLNKQQEVKLYELQNYADAPGLPIPWKVSETIFRNVFPVNSALIGGTIRQVFEYLAQTYNPPTMIPDEVIQTPSEL